MLGYRSDDQNKIIFPEKDIREVREKLSQLEWKLIKYMMLYASKKGDI